MKISRWCHNIDYYNGHFRRRKEIIMNKEQIKKHKEVIQWFINNPDKGVWYKGFTGE